MKNIIMGVIYTLFVYMVISMYNHTWDLMNFSEGSVFAFGTLIIVGWLSIGIINELDYDN